MKLIGRLKKDVESATSKTEANEILMNAGVELTPDELEYVTGGNSVAHPTGSPSAHYVINSMQCTICGRIVGGSYEIEQNGCPGCGTYDRSKFIPLPTADAQTNLHGIYN